MKQEIRLASLMLVPYVVAALSAVGVAGTGPGHGQPLHNAVSSPAAQALYAECRDHALPAGGDAARAARAQQSRQAAHSRSQHPAWQAQARSEIEHCLQVQAGGRWAQRLPAGASAAL